MAVLTIGAVSASEDADALAVDDMGDETVVEAPADENVTETAVADEETLESEENGFGFPYVYFNTHNITDGSDYIFAGTDFSGFDGTLSIFANESQVYNKDLTGEAEVRILASDLFGKFYGTYNMNAVYNCADGKNYTESATINFVEHIDNYPVAEDFNVSFLTTEFDMGKDDPAIITFLTPEGITTFSSFIVVYFGEWAHADFEMRLGDVGYYRNITWGDLGIENPGVYNLSVCYLQRGSGFRKLANTTINVTSSQEYTASPVKTAIAVSPASVSMAYNTNKELTVTLMDADSNPIKDQYVKIYVMGISYDVKTDANGKFKMSLSNLPPATHNIKFEFKDVAPYEGTTKTVTVKITKATPKLIAKAKTFKKATKTKKYTVTLKNNLNKVMKNALVTLKVNKKTFKVKTNSKGQAIFKITNLKKKGTFKATVTYKGDSYYNKVIKKNVKIIVK